MKVGLIYGHSLPVYHSIKTRYAYDFALCIECIHFVYCWCCCYSSSSSSSCLFPQGGLSRLDTFLHSILSSTFSRSTTLSSSRTPSLSLLLVPGSLRSADHLTNLFHSLHDSIPPQSAFSYLLSQFRFNSCLMSSFLILSLLVTPLMARKHLISTTSNFFTCSSFTVIVTMIIINVIVIIIIREYFLFRITI